MAALQLQLVIFTVTNNFVFVLKQPRPILQNIHVPNWQRSIIPL